DQKITRLAYQVYENNFEEKEILICGIAGRGFILAKKLATRLREISSFRIEEAEISLNKENPAGTRASLTPSINTRDKTVILCDDVLYTGRTMAYAAIPFLIEGVRKLQCLVLIHRNHLHFPIQPNFIGLALATTLHEHVQVDFDKGTVSLS
nr:phosphoribosyltransferase [Bacteroidota bacterium]